MKFPHPLSLILLAGATILAATSRQGSTLYLAAAGLVCAALLVARPGFRLLVWRSRWLLLTMLVLFGWLTPGTPMPIIPGATEEGMRLAGETIARFMVALATLALLFSFLSPAGLVAGLHALLAPLELAGCSRDRIAVRLALTLQEVEASRSGQGDAPGGNPDRIALPAHGFGVIDIVLVCASTAVALAALLT